MPIVTAEAVGWFCRQKLAAAEYTCDEGPCVSRRWLSSRQKPTFMPGVTSAVRAAFHSE